MNNSVNVDNHSAENISRSDGYSVRSRLQNIYKQCLHFLRVWKQHILSIFSVLLLGHWANCTINGVSEVTLMNVGKIFARINSNYIYIYKQTATENIDRQCAYMLLYCSRIDKHICENQPFSLYVSAGISLEESIVKWWSLLTKRNTILNK